MVSKISKLLCLLMVAFAASCTTLPTRSVERVLLVVPNRYTLVQFAFDIVGLRTGDIVSYNQGRAAEEAVLHMWNPNLQDWVRISSEEYNSGSVFHILPERIYIIGPDSDVPEGISSPTWCSRVKRVRSLSIKEIVNSMHVAMQFSSREWKHLAARHRLKIKDANEDRRRYGRYGNPYAKTHQGLVPVDQQPIVMDPVPVEDQPAIEELELERVLNLDAALSPLNLPENK